MAPHRPPTEPRRDPSEKRHADPDGVSKVASNGEIVPVEDQDPDELHDVADEHPATDEA